MNAAAPASRIEPMPRGIHNVYIFDIFNTASWSVILGSPMLLFLQHLNATATILAIAASLAPILNILQIPAARYVEQIGYKRFVLGGWTSRSFLIIGMTAVAFAPDSFDRATRISLMLFLLFIYNVLRGISVCGMLPWFTHIVPESRRGEFLARDQSGIAFSQTISLFIGSLLLADSHAWYSFGVLFTTSVVAAFTSLVFLRRIPDVPVEQIAQNTTPLPWREMFFFPPFFRYIRFVVITNMALGASNVFWVRYFRVFLHVSDCHVVLVACLTNIVLCVALLLVTSMIDRAGNRLVLSLATILLMCHFSGWALVAAGIVPFNYLTLSIQSLTAGFGVALWNISNVRTVMSLVPVMGRAHFLALYSVASNLTLGCVPLVWGPVLDLLDNWQVKWGPWHWNNYSLLYCTLAFTMAAGLVALRALPESASMTWDVFMSELLVKTPSRALSRLIGRLRGPGIG